MSRKKLKTNVFPKLSKAGRLKFKSIRKDEFNNELFKIKLKLSEIETGPSYDDHEEIWCKEHDEIILKFLKYLAEKKVSRKSLELYDFVSTYFLDEVLYHYGKHVKHITEIELVELMFDRYIRKVPLSEKEIGSSLKVIYVFYKFLLQEKVISVELYNFMKELRRYQPIFDRRIENKPSTGLFWDIEQSWEQTLFDFKANKLQMVFILTPIDLDSPQYIGFLESELTKILQTKLNVIWRQEFQLDSTEFTDLLIDYSVDWFAEPKEYLEGLSPKDWIIIEREFTDFPKFE